MFSSSPTTKRLSAVVGGSIGSDPYGIRTWSGITWYFFSELERQGLPERRLGGAIGSLRRYALYMKNCACDRTLWRQRFYMDRSYRDSLTKSLAHHVDAVASDSELLQIGAMFNLSEPIRGRTRCFSYHDGNLAQSLRSGQTSKGISKHAIEQCSLTRETFTIRWISSSL